MRLPDTTWYSHVFTNHIEVSKVSCLQWHVSSIELNTQLRDILNHLKPTAEAAASTSVFVHLILGENTYMCFTTLGALSKHFFGFHIPSRSGQPQLSNLTEKLLHTNTFTHKHFYAQTFLHTKTLLHTDAFTHRRFYTQTSPEEVKSPFSAHRPSFRAKGLLQHK